MRQAIQRRHQSYLERRSSRPRQAHRERGEGEAGPQVQLGTAPSQGCGGEAGYSAGESALQDGGAGGIGSAAAGAVEWDDDEVLVLPAPRPSQGPAAAARGGSGSGSGGAGSDDQVEGGVAELLWEAAEVAQQQQQQRVTEGREGDKALPGQVLTEDSLVVVSSGACCPLSCARSLVHMYCTSLAQDV